MTITLTLAQLLQARDRNTITAMLLATMQTPPAGAPLPVTDWYPGSIDDTLVKMMATGLLDRESLIPFLAGANFLDYASTMVDADGNPIEGWMELLAWNGYGKNRIPATFTQQRLTLTCTSGPGPYTRAAGTMIAYAPATGNRYINVASVTIPDGGSVVAVFQAESPGLGYNDQIGSIVALTTPLPGVSVTNLPASAGAPVSNITGSGSIAVTSTNITTNPRAITVRCVTTGRIGDGSALFTVTVNQGTTATTTGSIAPTDTYVTGGDVTLSFTDGPSSTNSFFSGDFWTVGVPGTSFLQVGADKESLAQLALRCRDVFPSQSPIATPGRYAAWAREANAAAVPPLGITKIWTQPSDLVAGEEDIYLAGPTSTATSDQIAAVQAYIDQRISDIETASVQSAAGIAVTPNGFVFCHRGTTVAVQKKADAAWSAYIAGLPIGGEQPGGIVKLAALEDIIMNAGAFDTSELTLNGYAQNLQLSRIQCATLGTMPSAGLGWNEVI